MTEQYYRKNVMKRFEIIEPFNIDFILDYLKYYDVNPKSELLSHCFDLSKNPDTYFIGEYKFHKTLFMTDFNVYDLTLFKSIYKEISSSLYLLELVLCK